MSGFAHAPGRLRESSPSHATVVFRCCRMFAKLGRMSFGAEVNMLYGQSLGMVVPLHREGVPAPAHG